MEVNKIYTENCLETVRRMPDGFLNCVVTSPPYYGLRNYQHDEQFGLEETPEAYVQSLVDLFREIRRALRDDGTVWLNLGDSYWGGGWKGSKTDLSGTKQGTNAGTFCGADMKKDPKHPVIKPKDLVGIPWRVAFALRADGWHLRQDIIWHKPNPMPESVTDRCTKSHEYIFLLTKSAKYYYDSEAVKESCVTNENRPNGVVRDREYGYDSKQKAMGRHKNIKEKGQQPHSFHKSREQGIPDATPEKRNKRSVWTVTTKPYSEAHFATYPEALIVPCIKAGCPEGGIVYDPFGGAGTTALVSHKLKRNWVLSELNPEYVKIAEKRLRPWLKQTPLMPLF